jgi:hypothetical protein
MRNRPLHVLVFTAFAATATAALPCAAAAEPAKTQATGEPAKTQTVISGGLKLTVPAGWKSKDTKSNFRLMDFTLPKAEGDKDSTECVAWYYGTNGSGGVNENFQRFIDEFQPKDRKVKVTKGKAPEGDYVVVDIEGVWNRPVDTPQGGLKIVPTPSARVVGLSLYVPHVGPYYLKMGGPEKTVAANADALRAAIGADSKTEKDYFTKPAAPKVADEKAAPKK